MKSFSQKLQHWAVIIFIGTLFSCGEFSTNTARTVDPVYYKSAVELTRAIRQGEITSSELLERYLVRIKRYNSAVNAVVAMDEDKAKARAAQADKALSRGELWGPLHGLPMTVKEAYAVVGMPATAGDPEFKNHMPKQNAIAVQRLIDAGAIVFGKTNMPFHAKDFQTFNKVYGTTNNPWDLSRTPGGSSGGSAAALAMGFTPLELGSDIAGSLRVPAHFTGVFAHKPTFGIIPRYGHFPPLPGSVTSRSMPLRPLSVAGPMARSAEDLELAMDILTAPGKPDMDGSRPERLPGPKKPLQDYRVAVWLTDPYSEAEIDAQVMSVLLKAVNILRKAGVQVDEKAPPGIKIEENLMLFLDIHSQMAKLPLPGEIVTRQKKMQARWAQFFETYDVLLAPVTPTLAFPHDQTQPKEMRELVINGKHRSYMASNFAWTLMAVVSGLPVTAAPVGLSDSGLPVGVQIIGASLDDRKTIAFAKGLSTLVGGGGGGWCRQPIGTNDRVTLYYNFKKNEAYRGKKEVPVTERFHKKTAVSAGTAAMVGLVAGITVYDSGAKALILKKAPKAHEGGNSKVSGNIWWAPTNVDDALKYITAMCYGLTDQDSIKALARGMFENNEWLEKMGVEPKLLGMFQPEYPELPGSQTVRTYFNARDTFGGNLYFPLESK